MRLTDASLKSLKAPEKGAVIYADDALAGFGVRVSQAGTKSYVLTHGVRRQRETIGRVGIITLHVRSCRSEASPCRHPRSANTDPQLSAGMKRGKSTSRTLGKNAEPIHIANTSGRSSFTFGSEIRSDLPLVASNAVTTTNPGGDNGYGVGRPLVSAFLANILNDRWAYAFGSQIITPAASGTQFGSSNWDVRPLLAVRAMLLEIGDGSYFVPLVRYARTIAQAYSKRPSSNLQFSPQLKIALQDGWSIELFPSPDIRWNFGAKPPGQTGRLFFPLDGEIGKGLGKYLVSPEVSVPVVKDYPIYHYKIEARLSYQL